MGDDDLGEDQELVQEEPSPQGYLKKTVSLDS